MNTVIFNENTEQVFTITSFSRNTTFDGERNISSQAYFDIIANEDTSNQLLTLGYGTITSFAIYHDDERIYSASDIQATISYINETLNDNTINVQISIRI